jgi:hypothetical protein
MKKALRRFTMAKKILSEAQVRRFAKLANLSPINEMYANEEEEAPMAEQEDPMDDVAADAEEEAPAEMDAELDAEAGEEAIEMDADGAADVDLSQEDVSVLEQAVDILSQITSAAGGGEEEMGDEPVAELEPMGDEPMGDEPMGDEPMGDEEEEEMIAEALKGINYQPGRKEIVQQVAKRVAKRLLEAKKAEARMNKALGNKGKRTASRRRK